MAIQARGCWPLPGGKESVWVFGQYAFVLSVNASPKAYVPATFSIRKVGTLGTSSGPVSMRDNGLPGGVVCIVDGPSGYFYYFNSNTKPAGTFEEISDPAFLGADTIAYIDGWWIFNQPGTQIFYTPQSTYSTVFNASNFALKDGSTDILVSLHENKEELWLFGETTTEIWFDAGGQYFAFQRLVSTMLQVGCSAKHSVARFSSEGQQGLIWLARSERGENVILKSIGFNTEEVSTPAINDAIAKYQKIDDAIGFVYQEDGHEFYQITFPSADATWVFDGMTRMWHRRGYFEQLKGLLHRDKANCFCNFQNQRLVGDYANGSIYRLDRSIYTDGDDPLLAWRRSPIIWDGGARERVFLSALQVEFSPGQGLQSGQGSAPVAYLQVSRDSGTTFGNRIPAPMGVVGNYINRCIWRRLGQARAGVLDMKVYDPVNRDIVGATLKRFFA